MLQKPAIFSLAGVLHTMRLSITAQFESLFRLLKQSLKKKKKKRKGFLLTVVTLALLVAIFTRTIGNYVETGGRKKSFIMNTTFSDCK